MCGGMYAYMHVDIQLGTVLCAFVRFVRFVREHARFVRIACADTADGWSLARWSHGCMDARCMSISAGIQFCNSEMKDLETDKFTVLMFADFVLGLPRLGAAIRGAFVYERFFPPLPPPP